MSQYLIDQIKETQNIQIEFNTEVTAVHGEGRLRSISLTCNTSGETQEVPATALFIFIGAEPRTAWLDGVIQRDARGFIMTGPDLMQDGKKPKGWALERDPRLLETNVPGVFAVGDVRHGSIKRVASGVGEGSVAIQFVHQYLSKV
jgi:thioredoxin reductase (NADPH)